MPRITRNMRRAEYIVGAGPDDKCPDTLEQLEEFTSNRELLNEFLHPRVWQDDADYYARKNVLCNKGMTARISLKWLPGYKGDHDLLVFVVTPLPGKGKPLHIHRPPHMHISIGFRNELVGIAAEIAQRYIYRKWHCKIVHCTFRSHMSATAYFSHNTGFMRDPELRFLHSMSRRYGSRAFHVSM